MLEYLKFILRGKSYKFLIQFLSSVGQWIRFDRIADKNNCHDNWSNFRLGSRLQGNHNVNIRNFLKGNSEFTGKLVR